jgi:hypothetical protein
VIDYSQVQLKTIVRTAAATQKTHYTAQEAAIKAGISKPTLLRWIKSKRVKDSAKRDRNGWRMFSMPEIDAIRLVAQRER